MDTTPDFDRFWTVYPRREAKRDAFKAWQRIKPSEIVVDLMVSDVTDRLQRKLWRLTERQYIPLPATYLRGARWEDEREPLPMPSRRGCSHEPPCENPGNWRCQQRTQIEQYRKGA